MVQWQKSSPTDVDSYVFNRIRSVLDSLSPSERRVAEAILEYPEECLHWSAAELAGKAGTSDATAVRTCRRLGFAGLCELRVTLARDLGWSAPARSEASDESRGSVVRELFGDAARALAKMVTYETESAFSAAVSELASARRTLVVGNGSSGILAQDYAYLSNMSGRPVEYSTDPAMQTILASQLSESDVCLAISASGMDSLTIGPAETARSAGARLVVVTGFSLSRLSEIATVTVLTENLDYSTISRAAVSSAGMLLMLRALGLATLDRCGLGVVASDPTLGRAMSVFRNLTYRPPGNHAS